MTSYYEGREASGNAPPVHAILKNADGVQLVEVATFADLAQLVADNVDAITVQGKASDHGIIAAAVSTFHGDAKPFWRMGRLQRPFKAVTLGSFEDENDDVIVVVTFAAFDPETVISEPAGS